jgi:ABC-type glycerol-3-phosphate transport system substrate-binding protein
MPKSALGALAGLVLVFASGCSSPAETPADASTSDYDKAVTIAAPSADQIQAP